MIKIRFLFILLLSILTVSIYGCKKSDSGGGNSFYVPVNSVKVPEETVTLYRVIEGLDKYQIKPIINPNNASNRSVNYSITNGHNVISVDNKGLVKALKAGVATVLIKSNDNAIKNTSIQFNVSDSNDIPNESESNVVWTDLPTSPITGNVNIFDENISNKGEQVNPDYLPSLVGHYRIVSISITDNNNTKIVDNIIGTGDNMYGEFVVNAEACELNYITCPIGLRIRMQYKLQFHPTIVSKGIPESIRYVRKDILTPLMSEDIIGEFQKLGAKFIENPQDNKEWLVVFDLNSKKLPIPKGYITTITLKKIADDVLLDSKIKLDDTKYFSESSAVTGIELSRTNITLVKGSTATMDYKIFPVNAGNKKVKFTSKDDNVAKIDETTGEITAVAAGETIITYTTDEGGFEAQLNVKVTKEYVPVERIHSQINQGKIDANPSATLYNYDVFIETFPKDATDTSVSIASISDPSKIQAQVLDDGQTVRINALSRISEDNIVVVTIASNDNPQAKVDLRFFADDTTVRVSTLYIRDETGKDVADNISIPVTPKIYYKNLTPTFDLSRMVEIEPNNAVNKKLSFITNRPDVANVDDKGIVTLVNAGEVTITVTAIDNDGNTDRYGNLYASKKYTFIVENEYKHIEKIDIKNELKLTVFNNIAQTFSIGYTPEDASDKTLTYESENPGIVSVDQNTGVIRYVGQIYNSRDEAEKANIKEGEKVKIIVKSKSNPSVITEGYAVISLEYIDVENVEITNESSIKKELKAMDYNEGVTYINAKVIPETASVKGLNYKVISGNDIVSVDQNGKVTALKSGKATIRIEAQANSNKYKELEFTVWEKINLTGRYTIKEFYITYNNRTVKSNSQSRRFFTDKTNFYLFSNINEFKVSGKLQLGWGDFAKDPMWDNFRFIYFNYVDNSQMNEKDMSIEGWKNKKIIINDDGSIKYEFPFIISGNELKYEANSPNKIEFIIYNRTGSFSSVNSSKYLTVTPANIDDPYSLQGTYNMTFFGTIPQVVSCSGAFCGIAQGEAQKPITTSCSTYKSATFLSSKNNSCSTGTSANEVENFKGFITVTKDSNSRSLTIRTKVTMRNTTMDANAENDKYQYTKYNKTSNSDDFKNISGSVKGVSGRNLKGRTNNPNSTFKISAASSAQENAGNITVDLILKEKHVSAFGVTLNLDAYTQVRGNKTSDIPVNLDPNSMDDMKDVATYSAFTSNVGYSDPQ